ncbi:hypothetical protein HKBW3S06_00547, partial [Candidatus Hakubella thermalkaliphila]
ERGADASIRVIASGSCGYGQEGLEIADRGKAVGMSVGPGEPPILLQICSSAPLSQHQITLQNRGILGGNPNPISKAVVNIRPLIRIDPAEPGINSKRFSDRRV